MPQLNCSCKLTLLHTALLDLHSTHYTVPNSIALLCFEHMSGKIMSQKRKVGSYTLAEKYEILLLLNKGEKACKLSKPFNIPKNSISTWAKPENKQKIMNEFESGTVGLQRKRFKEGKYSDIEDALLQWVKDLRSRSTPVPIDGKTLKCQAERLVLLYV